MDARPAVDVVVPAFNEESDIDECLDTILALDYPADRLRVFVVDAGSQDGTVARIEARAARDERIVPVFGHGRLNAAEAVNLGLGAGDAPLVARIDAHTFPDSDYLARAADVFAAENTKLGAVGGEAVHVGRTPFGRAVGHARRSRFGVGGSVYAERRDRVYLDTLPLVGVFRREAVEEVGGFSAEMLVGEDEELNWRLNRAGWKLLLDRSLRIRYLQRSSWSGLFRQYRNYGQSRMRVIAEHPDFVRPRHLAPAAFVAGGAVIAVASLGSPTARRVATACVAAYGGAAVLAARRAASEGGEPELWPRVATAFSAMHVGYGVGLLEGAAQLAAARLGGGTLRRAVRDR